MVMANLFLNSDIEMAVAHCNFGLRGAESEADEQFVKEWASKMELNAILSTWQ